MFKELVKDVPPITRLMCLISFVLMMMVYMDVVTASVFYFHVKLITSKLQVIWRQNNST